VPAALVPAALVPAALVPAALVPAAIAVITKPIIISIEGNIGSGKSTLLAKLQEVYGNDSSICFLQEPVDIWETIKDEQGTSILEKYYADQKRYAFSFQMMAYISRISLMRAALKKNYRVIIIERSVYTDSAVFAKMLFDAKKIEEIEYKIYLRWVNEFIADFPAVRFVYVRAEPTVSCQRILHRGRAGEVIPLDYLENCHKYHDDWLLAPTNTSPLLLLDANVDITQDSESLNRWLTDIQELMAK
jgi:deoxyadenosine/deoxycytidine kinase